MSPSIVVRIARRLILIAALGGATAAGVGASPHAAPSHAAVAAATGTHGFRIAVTPYRFVFPRDHAAHDGYASEWWYYTGHLRAADGRRFGYELTFFRIGLRPGDPQPLPGQSRWRGNQIYFAHFAITDESRQRFTHHERFAREALGSGFASTQRLDVRIADWWLRGGVPGAATPNAMRMHARAGGEALDVSLVSTKPPAVHGHGGVSRKAACASCASHYYSLTRLRTVGTLRSGGTTFAVGGISWMDHEFGSDELQADQAGWDWFSLQLDDGRELMLYRLREKSGGVTPQSSGSVIERDGTVRHLALASFSVDVRGRWKSPHTGAVYPSGWRVRVPSAGVDVTLTPTVNDQELSATAGGISYWEGAVDARSTASGRSLGVGYVELTGYARPLAL